MSKPMSLRVDEDLLERFREAAAADRRPVSQWILLAAERALEVPGGLHVSGGFSAVHRGGYDANGAVVLDEAEITPDAPAPAKRRLRLEVVEVPGGFIAKGTHEGEVVEKHSASNRRDAVAGLRRGLPAGDELVDPSTSSAV